MKLVGANPNSRIEALEELPGKVNYFIGNDSDKWRTNIPTYTRVKYQDIYPGIDLVFYGSQRQLEHDFIVAPGADPEAIKLAFEGADKAEIDARGDLILHTAGGELRLHNPRVYQESNGVKQLIPGGYVLLSPQSSSLITFHVAAYDTSNPLILDPVLSYSTYLGGSSIDIGDDIAVDSSGNAYVAGFTDSGNFPTANPLQATNNGNGAFVTKFNAAGSALVYSTYLGGHNDEHGSGIHHIAVDSSGNAYVTGSTSSMDFPTASPLQPALGAGFCSRFKGLCPDAFVTKVNATGNALVYSTYLGGGDVDESGGIAVDASGNVYVTGQTSSGNFPTANPLQAGNNGGSDTFVTKINAAGSALVYSTYLGGSSNDAGNSIAVDSSGNVYVTGWTGSINFPTTPGAFDTICGTNGNCDPFSLRDAFVTKVNAVGSTLVYSTYLGGSDNDQGSDVVVDASGNAYVTGGTNSTNFPTTVGAFQTTAGGVFVTKINTAGSALVYSTFLGNAAGAGSGIALDSSGNAYVTGSTASTNFPTANPLQAANGGSNDVFVTKINAAGNALIYSTYLGGSSEDRGSAITLDTSGNAYVTGSTASTNFPTANALQATFGGTNGGTGSGDAFIAKIAEIAATTTDLSITKTGSPDSVTVGNNLTYTISVANNGPDTAPSVIVTDVLPAGVTFVSSSASQGNCSGASTVTCNLGTLANRASATVTIVVKPTAAGTLSNTATVTRTGDPFLDNNTATAVTTVNASTVADLSITKTDSPDPVTVGNNLTYMITVTNSGPGTATGVTLADTLPAGVTFVSTTTTKGTCVGRNTVNCNLVSLANGASATVTIVVTPTVAGGISNTATVAGTETDPNPANNTATAVTTVQNPEPRVSVAPTSLFFAALAGGSAPESQNLTITTSGTGTLSWSVAVNVPWLMVSPTSGSSTGESTSVSVSVVPTGLPAGRHTGTLTLTAPGVSNSPQTVAVTLDLLGSTWAEVSAFGRTPAGPGAAFLNDDLLGVVQGTDTKIYFNRRFASGVWTGWSEVPGGGATLSGPGVVSLGGELWVFVRGTTNRLYFNRLIGGSWSGWGEVPGGGLTSSGPAAAVFNNDLYLLVRGTDDRIYLNRLTTSGWTGWSEVPGGGLTPSEPGVGVLGSTLYVVVQGIDARLYVNALSGGLWTGWSEVPGGGATPAGPGVAAFQGELWVVVQGTDELLYRNRFAPQSGWTGWRGIAGGGATASKPGLAATASILSLVIRDHQSRIYINQSFATE